MNFNTGTREYIESIFNGQTPVEREYPLAGQSKYFYFKPGKRDDISVSDMETVDVPTADTPNPFLSGTSTNPYPSPIQNEIYNKDRSTYNQPYGSPTTPTIQTQSNKDPNCYIEFNGQDVDLYKYGQHDGTRLQNGQLQGNLNAQSGRDGYQSGIYQDVPNKGPIPEGTYYADQDQRQNITALDAVAGTGIGIANKLGANIHRGTWNGGPISWGTSRVWLRPDANTNTYGRSGFSIHGGWSKGSAGCIDIPWQTGKLSDYLDDCQDSVPVYVKYPKGW